MIQMTITVTGTWPSGQTQTPLVLQQWGYKQVSTSAVWSNVSVIWNNALGCNHIQH